MDVGAFILALAGGLLIVCLLLMGALMRLRRRVRRHRALIDQLPQTAVVSFNRELIVTFAAGPALGGGGWGADALEGKSILEMFAPAQADALRPKFDAALRGEKRSFEYRSPGSGREYSMRVVPFADAHGHVETGLFMARDVTETTQVEGEFASRVADVGAVSQATRALARSLDPAAARKAFCTGACEVAQAPVAVLFEPEKSSPSLVAQASVGAEVGDFEVAIDGESGAALAFSRAEEVFVSLGSASEADEKFMRQTRSEAVLWHPVVRDRAAIGVLAVAWSDETAGVSLRLSAMLDVLAAEATVAIGRSDLLGQLEYMARRSERPMATAASAASTSSIAESRSETPAVSSLHATARTPMAARSRTTGCQSTASDRVCRMNFSSASDALPSETKTSSARLNASAAPDSPSIATS